MRKVILLCVLLLAQSGLMQAQKKLSNYLFDEFQQAAILTKDGRRFQERMNYNLFTEKFCFIDRDDNQEKELNNPQEIQVIRFGSRVFYPEITGEGIEILSTTPVLYVQYKAEYRKKANTGAYGQPTETSAIRTVGGIYGSGGQRHNYNSDQLELGGRYNLYQIDIKGKRKSFKNFKQFVKLYPKPHRLQLEQFIANNHVDFNDAQQIAILCGYAESLK